jgi:dipeptidyl-peptidase 4
MRRSFAFVSLIFFALSAQAQMRISMSDAMMQERTKFRPTSLAQLQWIPESESFTYLAHDRVVRISASKPKQTDSLDLLPGLNRALHAVNQDSLSKLGLFTWQTPDEIRFVKGENYYSYQLSTEKLTLLASTPKEVGHVDQHKNGKLVAYTAQKGLWIANGTQQIEVVKSEAEGIVFGTSVHRDEFGISKGTFWSGDGTKLAFYRMDESMVTQYPIYVLDSMPAQPRFIRYPFAGAKSHHVTVGVYDLGSKKLIYLQTGLPADQYLTNVCWTPDSRHILIAVVNREQNKMWLRKYDAMSGAFVATLLEESSKAWVEPEHAAEFLKDGRFIWQSEKTGYNHLYLHAADGKLLKQLTSGARVVTQFFGLSSNEKYITFQWADSTGLDRHISRIELANGKELVLSDASGTHNALVSSSAEWWLDEFSSLNIPRTITLRNIEKPSRSTQLLSALDPNQGYAFGKVQINTLRTPEGIALNERIILPHGFDATKKYPVLLYVYNGPHVQLVTNSWMGAANLWMQRMAQEGYIIYTIDGRGSANRGYAFESAIHRQIGTNEVADQLYGLAQLKKQTWVDASRIGVYGWSYGGYMTTSLLTRPEAKEVFKCGVAGGAVTDWAMYEIMYTERYMDTPQENPDGYKLSSTFSHLSNLKVPFLTIHGTSDDVVLWQHTLRYTQECIRKGIQIEYFPYPEHLHNVRGKDRVHLFEKIEGFLLKNL